MPGEKPSSDGLDPERIAQVATRPEGTRAAPRRTSPGCVTS
jgi:hypothetical protein